MPRCTPGLPPPLVIDAALRELPLRIPTEVTWLRVLATPPGDAGSVLIDCMQCALEVTVRERSDRCRALIVRLVDVAVLDDIVIPPGKPLPGFPRGDELPLFGREE